MKPHVRKTKIIATLGPATDSPEMLGRMIEAGVNIFRLNMSHAPHDWVRRVVADIRRLSTELGYSIGILMDTQGPAIRTGDLSNPLNLKVGDEFTFTIRGEQSEELHSVDVNYDDLVKDLQVGNIVMVDNGVIHMKVLRKDGSRRLTCQVLTAATLGSRRHINLPGIKVNLPALTSKDLADVSLGIRLGIDYIALSFVREAGDVALLRQVLDQKNANIRIVAKIEDQMAVRNLDEIIDAADAIMVARGDLGIEIPYEELPIVQRRIVKSCLHRVKPVIVATHMLESMIGSPMPTRAEITDVANAVFEEADAVMLSGETTVGKYPVECVNVLDRVAVRTERSGGAGYHEQIVFKTDHERMAGSAVHMANEIRAKGICVFTRHGNLAAIVAGLRPRFSLIYAFTPTEAICCHLALLYGVIPFQVNFTGSPDTNIMAAESKLKRSGCVETGDKLIVIADLVVADEIIHSIHLRVVH